MQICAYCDRVSKNWKVKSIWHIFSIEKFSVVIVVFHVPVGLSWWIFKKGKKGILHLSKLFCWDLSLSKMIEQPIKLSDLLRSNLRIGLLRVPTKWKWEVETVFLLRKENNQVFHFPSIYCSSFLGFSVRFWTMSL